MATDPILTATAAANNKAIHKTVFLIFFASILLLPGEWTTWGILIVTAGYSLAYSLWFLNVSSRLSKSSLSACTRV